MRAHTDGRARSAALRGLEGSVHDPRGGVRKSPELFLFGFLLQRYLDFCISVRWGCLWAALCWHGRPLRRGVGRADGSSSCQVADPQAAGWKRLGCQVPSPNHKSTFQWRATALPNIFQNKFHRAAGKAVWHVHSVWMGNLSTSPSSCGGCPLWADGQSCRSRFRREEPAACGTVRALGGTQYKQPTSRSTTTQCQYIMLYGVRATDIPTRTSYCCNMLHKGLCGP